MNWNEIDEMKWDSIMIIFIKLIKDMYLYIIKTDLSCVI